MVHQWVSVEATGAWESDWALADRLEEEGLQVMRVWVAAPLRTTLGRMSSRQSPRVECSPQEAVRLYSAATGRAATERFRAVIDTEARTACQATGIRHVSTHRSTGCRTRTGMRRPPARTAYRRRAG